MKLNILGVKIDNLTKEEVLGKVHDFLSSDNHHQTVTVNPEFIMAAQHDEEFKGILNKADLSVADGVGIKFAAKRLGQKLKARITGMDLIFEITNIAAKNNKTIFLLGAKKRGAAEQTAFQLMQKYSGLKIVGAESGFRNCLHRRLKDEKIVEIINRQRPDILFVAFGHPKQEKWIYHHLPKMPSVKIALGVGGAFDYISGGVKRAPKWMRDLGLEWLFRLIRQPWRLPRIITATIKFSWAVLINKKNERA